MNLSEKFWESRSKAYGEAIEGVLPKSLPKSVNIFLDQWMYEKVCQGIDLKNKSPNEKIEILDLGCGYGRISEKILRDYKLTIVKGVDISQTYVNIFNKNLNPRGRAYKSDLTLLPFKNQKFDVAIVITSLIYLTSDQKLFMGIKELLRVLKKDGVFIVIESNPYGHLLFTLGELFSRRGYSEKIGENPVEHIAPQKMDKLVKKAGGKFLIKEGISLWTWMLPVYIFSSLISENLTQNLLQIIKILDQKFSWLLTPSLYISYIGQKR